MLELHAVRSPRNRIDDEHNEPVHFCTARNLWAVSGGIRAMALSALGVVFGDIGTSPLFTLKTVLGVNGAQALDRAIALGSLSPRFLDLDHHHVDQIRLGRHARR